MNIARVSPLSGTNITSYSCIWAKFMYYVNFELILRDIKVTICCIKVSHLPLASSPDPARNREKGLVTLAYVLCQQSSFGVDESRLSITNYYILDM